MSSTALTLVWIVVILSMLGCSTDGDAIARHWIAEMDARPADERVPNWERIRGLMTREALEVGALDPDFELRTDDGASTIRLSSFRAKQPVVLIFGSWT